MRRVHLRDEAGTLDGNYRLAAPWKYHGQSGRHDRHGKRTNLADRGIVARTRDALTERFVSEECCVPQSRNQRRRNKKLQHKTAESFVTRY